MLSGFGMMGIPVCAKQNLKRAPIRRFAPSCDHSGSVSRFAHAAAGRIAGTALAAIGGLYPPAQENRVER